MVICYNSIKERDSAHDRKWRAFMQYEYSLIHVSDDFGRGGDMYSLSLVDARDLAFSCNGKSVILSGKYLFCFSSSDKAEHITGEYTVKTLYFLPYFYNVNLNTAIIDAPVYAEMREKYGYPDFSLFRKRTNDYNGIIKLTDSEYESVFTLFSSAERHIDSHPSDVMWSCRTRSEIISVLRIAEAAQKGKHTDVTNEVLRYIRANPKADLSLTALCAKFNTNRTTLANTIKELTGLSPAQYVLSERLGQTRPELLFTAIPVAEVAEKYGFDDPNYYIRAFKKKYGTTPLQYRKNGFEKRISEEKNYHLTKGGTDLMTEDEFRNYLKRGLGLAVIRLRREPDKTRFREAFKEYVTVPRWYVIHAHAFEYEDELLSCFDDAEQIKQEIFDVCLSTKIKFTRFLVRILKRWGIGDSLEKRLKAEYEDLYNRVYTAADSIPDKSLYALFDKPCTNDHALLEKKFDIAAKSYPVCELNEIYMDYHTIFDAYAEYDDSKETEKRLIDKELEMRKKTGYVPSAPAYDVMFSRTHDSDERIREYVNGILPDGYMDKYYITFEKPLRPSQAEKLNADYFINGEVDVEKIVAFHSEYLPITVVKQVEQRIRDMSDKKRRIELMTLFQNEHGDTLVDTCLSELFLDELKECAAKNPASLDTYTLAGFVLYGHSDEIKKYAAELIDKDTLKNFAVSSYFLYNYKKEDRELFATKLSDTDAEDYGLYLSTFVEAIAHGVPDLPLEMLYLAFIKNGGTYGRIHFMEALYKGGVYNERIIEEALHDAYRKTRNIAALMRDKKPYIEIKKLNGNNAGDCVRFFEETEKKDNHFAIGLDRHFDKSEWEKLYLNPLQNSVFCDTSYLSTSVRVRLLSEGRMNGFIAYIGKKPVGFIDCGNKDDYKYLNGLADEAEKDEFVITAPVADDERVSEALIRRAAEYAEEDQRPVSKVYLQRSREKDDYEKIKDMFLPSGFEIYKQSDDDITLIKTSFSN